MSKKKYTQSEDELKLKKVSEEVKKTVDMLNQNPNDSLRMKFKLLVIEKNELWEKLQFARHYSSEINLIQDQLLLIEYAQNIDNCSRSAITKLVEMNSPSVLEILKNPLFPVGRRINVLNKLKEYCIKIDQEIVKQLALNDVFDIIRFFAVLHLENQDLLSFVAKNDHIYGVRMAALSRLCKFGVTKSKQGLFNIEKITDIDYLLALMTSDIFQNIPLFTGKEFAGCSDTIDRINEVEKLPDTELKTLSHIVDNDKSEIVAAHAVSKIKDQDLLLNYFQNHAFLGVKRFSIQNLIKYYKNESILIDIFQQEKFGILRYMIVGGIRKESEIVRKFLHEIRDEYPFLQLRKLADSRLDSNKDLNKQDFEYFDDFNSSYKQYVGESDE